MAIPNLLTLTTVNGKSTNALLTTTLNTALLTNAAASNRSYKIETIIVANLDAADPYDLTLGITKSGGSVKMLANAMPIAAASSVVVLQNGAIYLEEGDVLQGGADSANKLDITISYMDMT